MLGLGALGGIAGLKATPARRNSENPFDVVLFNTGAAIAWGMTNKENNIANKFNRI